MSLVRKNILFFQRSVSLLDGGVPRVTDVISKELISRGYNCYFVYYQNDNDKYPADIKLRLDLDASFVTIKKAIIHFIILNKIDVVVCQNADSFRFIRIYRVLRLKFPKILFLRFLHASPDYWKMSSVLVNKPILRQFYSLKSVVRNLIYSAYHPYISKTRSLYNIFDTFILLSDTFRDKFVALYLHRTSSTKLATIPNPLTFDSVDCSSPSFKSDRVVLIVSRLEENQKRISIALSVWEQITPTIRSGWRLVIVGSGPSERYYREIASNSELLDVEFVGHQWDVLSYYQAASIFLMTSSWEGFPMSLLEAQQNGAVPVVFDTFSAVTDILTNGVDGYIIQDMDKNGFLLAVTRLMQDHTLRSRMSKQAILNSHRFHVGRIGDMWERLLKQ